MSKKKDKYPMEGTSDHQGCNRKSWGEKGRRQGKAYIHPLRKIEETLVHRAHPPIKQKRDPGRGEGKEWMRLVHQSAPGIVPETKGIAAEKRGSDRPIISRHQKEKINPKNQPPNLQSEGGGPDRARAWIVKKTKRRCP